MKIVVKGIFHPKCPKTLSNEGFRPSKHTFAKA